MWGYGCATRLAVTVGGGEFHSADGRPAGWHTRTPT